MAKNKKVENKEKSQALKKENLRNYFNNSVRALKQSAFTPLRGVKKIVE